jgi:hypothetical protein
MKMIEATIGFVILAAFVFAIGAWGAAGTHTPKKEKIVR